MQVQAHMGHGTMSNCVEEDGSKEDKVGDFLQAEILMVIMVIMVIIVIIVTVVIVLVCARNTNGTNTYRYWFRR